LISEHPSPSNTTVGHAMHAENYVYAGQMGCDGTGAGRRVHG
jgi:hypothetical protein